MLRLQIPVQNSMCMTIPHPIQNLPHKILNHRLGQPPPLPNIVARLPLINKRLKVMINVFKHQIQSPARGLNDIEELNDVVVRQFAQEGDFADDIAGNAAFGGGVGIGDAFDGDGAAGGTLGSTINCAEVSWADQSRSDVAVSIVAAPHAIETRDSKIA